MNKNLTRKRIFEIIQIGHVEDLPSRLFDITLAVMIILNIIVAFLETFTSLSGFVPVFHVVEIITLIFFIFEYILRIWTADIRYPGLSTSMAVLKFIISGDGIIMLLTIIPAFFLSGFVVLRMLRVVRIFHLFRINANYDSFNVIRSVLYEKRNQIASSVFIIIVLILAASLCMYGAEHDVQPDKFKNAFSGIWWSVSTLLTIGYGDIYPITLLGRAMAVVISFLGVGAVAIPTGIISAGFIENYTEIEKTNSFEKEVRAITVNIDSAWAGLTCPDITEKYGYRILLIENENGKSVPDDNYIIKTGDRLLIWRR